MVRDHEVWRHRIDGSKECFDVVLGFSVDALDLFEVVFQ